jgi:hypothetical protein
MSRCLPQCSTCHAKAKVKRQVERVAMAQIHACRAGSFPVLIEEIIDEDSYSPKGVSEPDRGVADDDAYFDDGFDKEIEDSDRIFVAHILAKMTNISFERQVQFRSVWRRPLQRTQRPHPSATPSPPHYMNLKTYSARAPSIISRNVVN